MVFSSIPRLYLDPPNWQPQVGNSTTSDDSQLPPFLPPPPQAQGGDDRNGQITRTISMNNRARLSKLSHPEMVLKCPRCESTNTKFCYFNNYSLSQPRYYCKTCRRYWTRGGALRNIPVGGGCRRNKRTKGISRSKSPVTAENVQNTLNCSSNSTITTNTITTPVSSSTTDFFSHYVPHQPLQLPFLPSLHHVTEYGVGDIGFNFSSDSAGGGLELPRWRLQQFQQLQFSEPTAGTFQFDRNDGIEPVSTYVAGATAGDQFGSNSVDCVVNQFEVVKSEDNAGVNLSRNFLGMNIGNEEFWAGNININDLSVFIPSNTTTHLF